MSRLRRFYDSERGAAAVEFAIVAPLLIMLLFGIVEFGRAYNAQIGLSAATREGVRTMAISNDVDEAVEVTIAAAPTLRPTLSAGQVAVSPETCTPGETATVTATYPMDFIGGLFGAGITLKGESVMRCGG